MRRFAGRESRHCSATPRHVNVDSPLTGGTAKQGEDRKTFLQEGRNVFRRDLPSSTVVNQPPAARLDADPRVPFEMLQHLGHKDAADPLFVVAPQHE